MSVLEELEARLNTAEERAGELLARMEGLAALEDGLALTRRSLGQASGDLAALAVSTKAAANSLDNVLSAFRDAVEVLRRSNPDLVLQAVRVASTRQTEATQKVEESLRQNLASAEQGLRAQLEMLSGVLGDGLRANDVQRARGLRPLVFMAAATLVIAIAVLVITVYPLLGGV